MAGRATHSGCRWGVAPVISLVAAISLGQAMTSGPEWSRIDLAWRLRRTEWAWEQTPERRAVAVTSMSDAVSGFFAGNNTAVARALDTTFARLQGRDPDAADATTFRTERQPDGAVRVELASAYGELPPKPDVWKLTAPAGVSVRQRGDVTEFVPRPDTLAVIEARRDRFRMGLPTVLVGNREARLAAMRASSDPEVKTLRAFLEASDGRSETPDAIVTGYRAAELILQGRTDQVRDWVRVNRKGSTWRAVFPREIPANPTVLVAYHGAGGTADMFVEAYGEGRVTKEAIARGWIVISPSTSANALEDSLQWLQDRFKISPGRLVLLGHSMGGGVALRMAQNRVQNRQRVDALVLMAPAIAPNAALPPDVPVFTVVGQREIGMLRTNILGFARRNETRPGFSFRELPNSEHLMVVSDAIDLTYVFLDRVVPRRPR